MTGTGSGRSHKGILMVEFQRIARAVTALKQYSGHVITDYAIVVHKIILTKYCSLFFLKYFYQLVIKLYIYIKFLELFFSMKTKKFDLNRFSSVMKLSYL